MKASASILIDLSIGETFKIFSDVQKRSLYLPSVTKLDIHSLHTQGRGVEWTEERMEEGVKKTGNLTISSFNQPRSFVVTTHSSGLIFKTRYNFQSAGTSQTKVIISIGGRPKGILSGIMNKFLSKNSEYMGQQLQNELSSYKLLIERNTKQRS
jgi:hypothetical protein